MTSTLERHRSADSTGVAEIDPRMRARRDAVEADQRRRRARRWLIGLAVVAGLIGAWFLTRTALLDVDRIVVQGATHSSVDAIVEASSVRPGEPLLEVDEAASARRIRALPWIDTVTVARRWDGTVTIDVTERVAVAVVVDEAGLLLPVDVTGRILAPAIAIDGSDGPIATPIAGAVAVEPGARIEGFESALQVAALLTPGMRSRIQSITTESDGSLTLQLIPQGVASLGSPTDLAAKVAALRIVMAQVDQRDLATIDVMNPSTPVVTRTPRRP